MSTHSVTLFQLSFINNIFVYQTGNHLLKSCPTLITKSPVMIYYRFYYRLFTETVLPVDMSYLRIACNDMLK